jgi:hypothetical protein
MIEIIIISVLTVAVVISLVALLYMRKTSQDLASQLVQCAVTNIDLKEAMSRLKDEKELGENDGFVKFLSDSRDWAFEYIENVQSSIVKLEVAMAARNEEEISECYKALLNYIPKDEKNN